MSPDDDRITLDRRLSWREISWRVALTAGGCLLAYEMVDAVFTTKALYVWLRHMVDGPLYRWLAQVPYAIAGAVAVVMAVQYVLYKLGAVRIGALRVVLLVSTVLGSALLWADSRLNLCFVEPLERYDLTIVGSGDWQARVFDDLGPDVENCHLIGSQSGTVLRVLPLDRERVERVCHRLREKGYRVDYSTGRIGGK